MNKNGLIERAVEAEIARRIRRGELIRPCDADENLYENMDCIMKMMTIAVHDGLGVGKKRFQEKVNPKLWALEKEFLENRKTVDQVYAVAIIDHKYAQIMEK